MEGDIVKEAAQDGIVSEVLEQEGNAKTKSSRLTTKGVDETCRVPS